MKMSKHVKKVERDKKHWKDTPNRRGPVIGKIIEEMQKTCKDLD